MHSVQPLEWTGFQREGWEEKASPHGLPKPIESTATETHFIEGSQSKRTQFVRAWPEESKPKEILEECSAEHFMLFFPLFVTEVCFCFRLMLRLGDRVCTRACVLVQFCMSAWRYWKAEDCYERLWHVVYKSRHFLNVRHGFLYVQAFLRLFSISGSSGCHMAPHALLHFPSTISVGVASSLVITPMATEQKIFSLEEFM